MRYPLIPILVVLFLTSLAGVTLGQESAELTDPLMARAIEVSKSDGPGAAIEVLEAARLEQGLTDEQEIFLGVLLFTAGRAEESFAKLEPFTRSPEASPPLLFNAWRAADQTGRGAEHIALLQRAAAGAPGSPAARQLGFILGNQGRIEEAYRLLLPWARSQPNDVEARLATAHAALQLERVPVAEEMLADLPSDIPQVRLLSGKALYLRGDPRAALATLGELGDGTGLPPAIDLDRRHTMANCYVAIGESARAVELLEGYAADDPRLMMVLGRAQAQSGQIEQALATLRPLAQAAQGDPSGFGAEMSAGVLLAYGKALVSSGSPAGAIDPLTRASELDSQNAMVWQALGNALAVAGRREEATAALERFDSLARAAPPTANDAAALESEIDDPTAARLRRALMMANQGLTTEALAEVRDERLMAPGDPRVALVESRLLVMQGSLDAALAPAAQAVEMAPDFADAYYQRAVVLMGLEQLQQAENDFRAALEVLPTHTPAMNDLAVLLMMQQRNDEARVLLERALEINPADALAAQNLSEIDS